MSLVNLALRAELGAPEKLLLIYLASRANVAGVGLWNLEHLESVLQYKERTLQRHLKILRDDNWLIDAGVWYVLKFATLEGLSEFEIATLDMVTPVPSAPTPPPDPVRESPMFASLIAAGLEDGEAYEIVNRKLGDGQKQDTYFQTTPSIQSGTKVLMDGKEFSIQTDNAEGRFKQVFMVLCQGAYPTKKELSDWLPRWQLFEDGENLTSVKGEASGFELLYPAILKAAEDMRGLMTIDEFLDSNAIKACRAPWDRVRPKTDAISEREMQREIGRMIRELEACGNPNCQVQPQTKEKGDDGVVRMESAASFYRRVLSKYQQMQQLKAMGAL